MMTRQVYEFMPAEGTQVRVEVDGAVLRLILDTPTQTEAQPVEPTIPDHVPAFIGADAERAARVIVQYLWVMDTTCDHYGVDRALIKRLFDAASETLAGIAVGLDIYLQETIAACRLLLIRGDRYDPDVAHVLAFLETPLRVMGIPEAFTYSEKPLSITTTLQDIARAAA